MLVRKIVMQMLTQKLSNMKSNQTKLKAMLSVAAIAMVMVFSSFSANANGEKIDSAKSIIPVEVKYVGSFNNQPVLEVNLDNADGEEYKVTLKGENGELLYSATFKDKKITKRFQFDNAGINPTMRIQLTVATKKLSQTSNFEISNKRQVIEDVIVEKL